MAGKRAIKGIAEIVLRVRDLDRTQAFYEAALGLEVVQKSSDIVFLKAADLDSPLGYGGHPQLLGLVDRRIQLNTQQSTFDHIAFEIALEDFEKEKTRLEQLGLDVRTRHFSWSHARALFFLDPEGNSIEFICHDDSVR